MQNNNNIHHAAPQDAAAPPAASRPVSKCALLSVIFLFVVTLLGGLSTSMGPTYRSCYLLISDASSSASSTAYTPSPWSYTPSPSYNYGYAIKYEPVCWHYNDKKNPLLRPVYRWRQATTGYQKIDYFDTVPSSNAEIPHPTGFIDRSFADFYVLPNDIESVVGGTVPIWRLRSDKKYWTSEFRYATSAGEKSSYSNSYGFADEGILGFIFFEYQPGTVAIFNVGDELTTTPPSYMPGWYRIGWAYKSACGVTIPTKRSPVYSFSSSGEIVTYGKSGSAVPTSYVQSVEPLFFVLNGVDAGYSVAAQHTLKLASLTDGVSGGTRHVLVINIGAGMVQLEELGVIFDLPQGTATVPLYHFTKTVSLATKSLYATTALTAELAAEGWALQTIVGYVFARL